VHHLKEHLFFVQLLIVYALPPLAFIDQTPDVHYVASTALQFFHRYSEVVFKEKFPLNLHTGHANEIQEEETTLLRGI
jgi:hypothetical protein